MFIHKKDLVTNRIDHLKDGEGYVISTPLLQPETMFNRARIFGRFVLEPNCEIGWHMHIGEGEAYYILSGSGEYSDNGTMITLNAGDVAFCPDGEGHSIKNISDEPMEMIAMVIYK